MELSGALSNPRAAVEGCLSGLISDLRSRGAGAEPREPRPQRACRVQELVQRYVEAAGRPLRVRDVCDGLEALGYGPFDKAAVRKTLHDGSRARVPRYVRVGWGLYAAVPPATR